MLGYKVQTVTLSSIFKLCLLEFLTFALSTESNNKVWHANFKCKLQKSGKLKKRTIVGIEQSKIKVNR